MRQQLLNQLNMCKLLIRLCYQVSFINFFVSILIWYFFNYAQVLIDDVIYWTHYIVGPLLIILILIYSANKVVKSDRFSMHIKKYTMIFLMVLIAAILSIIHSTVIVLLVSFIIPIFISTLYSDEKLTTHTFIVSLCLLIGSSIYMALTNEFNTPRRVITETLVTVGIVVVTFLISRLLIRFNQAHITSLEIMYHDKMALKGQLNIDALTGIYNRGAFNEYLEKSIINAKQNNYSLGLAMIDIDDFKRINDTKGHLIGDKVLTEFAAILMMNQSENIHAFRIGGEEFAVIFSQNTKHNEKLEKEMYQVMNQIIKLNAQNNLFTISCGMSCLTNEVATFDALFSQADKALYDAKAQGKNKIVKGC